MREDLESGGLRYPEGEDLPRPDDVVEYGRRDPPGRGGGRCNTTAEDHVTDEQECCGPYRPRCSSGPTASAQPGKGTARRAPMRLPTIASRSSLFTSPAYALGVVAFNGSDRRRCCNCPCLVVLDPSP